MQALLERNTNSLYSFEPLSGPKRFVFKDKFSVHKRSKDNVSIRLWKIFRLLKGLKNPEVTKKSLNVLKSYLLLIQCYNLHTCLKDFSRFRSSDSFQLENFPWRLRLQTIQGRIEDKLNWRTMEERRTTEIVRGQLHHCIL